MCSLDGAGRNVLRSTEPISAVRRYTSCFYAASQWTAVAPNWRSGLAVYRICREIFQAPTALRRPLYDTKRGQQTPCCHHRFGCNQERILCPAVARKSTFCTQSLWHQYMSQTNFTRLFGEDHFSSIFSVSRSVVIDGSRRLRRVGMGDERRLESGSAFRVHTLWQPMSRKVWPLPFEMQHRVGLTTIKTEASAQVTRTQIGVDDVGLQMLGGGLV